MLNSRQRLGKIGEQAAAKFLKRHGYKILAQNYRCKLGEIDIIAKDGLVLVFIEVKTRSGTRYGSPAAAVNIRKQRQRGVGPHSGRKTKSKQEAKMKRNNGERRPGHRVFRVRGRQKAQAGSGKEEK